MTVDTVGTFIFGNVPAFFRLSEKWEDKKRAGTFLKGILPCF